MPIINPPDNFSHIEYEDADFIFSALIPPSNINVDANKLIIDEISEASYILSQFVFDNAGTGITQVQLPLKEYDGEFNSGIINSPFLLNPANDGIAGWGKCIFQNGQNGVGVEGIAVLKKVSGNWIIVCSVALGNYDRFTLELNYQSKIN